MRGTLQIEGSTSMAPVVAALADVYMALHGGYVAVEIYATGSGAGIEAAREGIADIGLSSRGIGPAELEGLRDSIIMAHDGIAVVVHPANSLSSITVEHLRKIYMGEVTRWEDIK